MKVILLHLILAVSSVINCQEREKNILWTVDWSPSGDLIATGGNQDSLFILAAQTLKVIQSHPIPDLIISRVKWHPTKNILAVITQSETFKAQILDLDSGNWTILKDIPSTMRAIDWNHSGSYLAVSELEKFVSVFDLKGNLVSRFQADAKGVTDIDWHPTKNLMVTVGSQIGIHELNGDTLKQFEPFEKETFMLCVEWHQEGKYFVVGDYGDLEKAENKSLSFWNEKGHLSKRISGSKGEYRNIRWSPDGQLLATATDQLRIYSKDGELLAASESSDDYLWGIDWDPDGKRIITSSSKGKLALWTKDAKMIQEINY